MWEIAAKLTGPLTRGKLVYIYKSQMKNLAHRITPEPRNRFGRQMSHWNRLTVLSVFLPNYGQITP